MTDTMNWADGPLHAALVAALPAFVNEPFAANPRLHVPKLGKAMGRSHETIYKWLRANKLNPRNVTQLVTLAKTEDNMAVLDKLGRTAPAVEDFTSFVFA